MAVKLDAPNVSSARAKSDPLLLPYPFTKRLRYYRMKLRGFHGRFEIGKSCGGFPLEGRRRSIAEREVATMQVIPALDEVEDRQFGLPMRAKPMLVE